MVEAFNGWYVLSCDYDSLKEEFARCQARVAELEAALREIGEEIAAHGCDGQFEEVCIHAERSPEDWCRYCRMGTSITGILPYTGSPSRPDNMSTGPALSAGTDGREVKP